MLFQKVFWLLVLVRGSMASERIRVISGTGVQPARYWLVFSPDGLLNLVFGLRVFLSFLGCPICFFIFNLGLLGQVIWFWFILRSKTLGEIYQPVSNIYALAPDSFHEVDQGFRFFIGFWRDLDSWKVF
jgi:hypothetical protein